MNRTQATRGATLPETAIVIAVALMVVFGSLQIALYGFVQISADGAAFVAANAANSGNSNGAALGSAIFPGIAKTNISLDTTSQPGLIIAKASTTLPGLPYVPGMPSSMKFTGADVEAASPAVQATPQPYSFSVTANLNNYCPYQMNCSFPNVHAMHLASVLNYSGNGKNGVFEEWYCHQSAYSSVSFPSSRPTPGPTWDPSNTASGAEYTIYSWDGGAAC